MHIHVIGINYHPEPTGIAVFTTGRAEYLAARGHRVTMCTAPPYYPQWRVLEGYRRYWPAREQRNGVEILRCPVYVPAAVTPARRVLHEASFLVSAFLRSLFVRRPDVLIAVSPPLGLAVVATVLAFMWRVPYLFDVQDLQPDTALDLGMVKPGRLTRLLYAVERLGYRHAARVSTLTAAMRKRIIAKGVAADTVVHVPLWAEPELFGLPPVRPDAAIRQELGLERAFVVLHAGNMGVKQGLDVVLNAAALLRDRTGVRFVLVGDGAVRAALEARARVLGLPNVHFIRLLPRARFLGLLATANVCLVTQQRSVADVVFPSKVLTLLAAAKPVVASVTAASAVAEVIDAAGAGIVVAPEEPAALLDAIERLRIDPDLRTRMAEAGRAHARRYWQREPLLAEFARTVEALGTGAATAGVPARIASPPHG